MGHGLKTETPQGDRRPRRTSSSVTIETAFERGRAAYDEHRGRTQVPYKDAALARAWEEGYDAALRERGRR